VGRLELAGRGFCTGALVAPDLVLTAAHCLHDRATGKRIDPARIEFKAGWRNGRAAAYRSVRRAVLGEAHVDRAETRRTEFDAPFQDLITEAAWGTVWAGERISRRERSMLTLALLAAMGNFDEIPMHIRATARTGASPADVAEAFQHVAIYAGVPRANRAFSIARDVYSEMEAEKAT